MSELSKVLGDLYGDSDPDAAPVRREPSAQERIQTPENVKGLLPEGVDDDLADALSDALQSVPESPSDAAEQADEWAEHLEERKRPVGHPDRIWQRSDDDIIPNWDRKRRKRRRG